jgi:hypothetical protein
MEAALKYVRRGWSVIPVRRSDKMPLVKWREFQNRIPTEDEVREWWTTYPNANVALITGGVSKTVVLDIDTRKGADPEQVWQQHPTALVAESGGGGAHLFYQTNGHRIRTGNSTRDIEVKGEGANVTLPPSIHPSGKRYRWLRKGAPAPFPDEIHAGPAVANNGSGNPEGWVSDLLKGVPENYRNDSATRLAGYYLRTGMPADIIKQTLVNWDLQNVPPLGEDTVRQIVDSVVRTRDSRSGATKIQVDSSVGEPFSIMALDDYMVKFGDTPVSWAVADWLPDETIAMAVAPPGTYKTWLELALAISVASGQPFLGKFEVVRPGPVIIIQQEDYHGQMAERLAVIMGSIYDYGAAERGDDIEFCAPPSLPIFLHPDRRFRFDDQVVVESLEEKIAETQATLVIIDPLYSTGPMDDYGVKLVNDMWPMKTLRDKYKCSFFMAHHTAKHKEETGREDLWGNQFLNAFIETGWQLRVKDAESAVVRRHFKSTKNFEEEVIKFNISTVPPYAFDVAIRKPTAEDSKMPDLIEMIRRWAPVSQSELARKIGVDKSTISRRLRKLKEAGMIVDTAEGMVLTGQPFDVA